MGRKWPSASFAVDDRKRLHLCYDLIGRRTGGSHRGLGHFGRLQDEGAADRLEPMSGGSSSSAPMAGKVVEPSRFTGHLELAAFSRFPRRRSKPGRRSLATRDGPLLLVSARTPGASDPACA